MKTGTVRDQTLHRLSVVGEMKTSLLYFNIIYKCRWLILIFWVTVGGIGAWKGPTVLNNTSMVFQAPPGSDSAKAEDALAQDYPAFAHNTQSIIYFKVDNDGDMTVVCNATREFSQRVEHWFWAYTPSQVPQQLLGYYHFLDLSMETAGLPFLGKNNRSMILVLGTNSSTVKPLREFGNALEEVVKPWLGSVTEQGISVSLTGFAPMMNDAQKMGTEDFQRMDVYVAPFAFLVLAAWLNSIRLVGVAIVGIAVALAGSLLILYATMDVLSVTTFAPVIMASCLIAMSIDYSLFLLTRFREEVDEGLDSNQAARIMLRTAGKNVLISSLTILVCFSGLIFFPVEFVSSVGVAATSGIALSLLVSVTLTPALILCFPSFFHIESSHYWSRASQWIRQRAWWRALTRRRCEKQSADSSADTPPLVGNDGPLGVNAHVTPAVDETTPLTTAIAISPPGYGNIQEDSDATPTIVRAADSDGSDMREVGKNGHRRDGDGSHANARRDHLSPPHAPIAKHMTWWRRLGLIAVRHSWAIVLIAAGISIPFALHLVAEFKTTTDLLEYVSANSSMAYRAMQSDFPAGALSPFFLLVDGRDCGVSVASDTFFQDVNRVVTELSVHVTSLNASMCTTVVRAEGTPFTYEFVYHMFLNRSFSPQEYDSEAGRIYRLGWHTLVNARNTSTVIEIQTDIEPYGALAPAFIAQLRAMFEKWKQHDPHGLGRYRYSLAGSAVVVTDMSDAITRLFPKLIAITLAAIAVITGLMFQSVLLPVRLMLTISLTLSWVYGLAVLVFEDGILHWLVPAWTDVADPALWFGVPTQVFSIVVGLGLDYDLFLMTRVQEYRQQGYSDTQSILRGLEKTGATITLAGVIMVIAFGGLLANRSIVVQQLAFFLVIAVIIDTFIVRTVVVPAVTQLFGWANWWPVRMPVTKS